jgi:predicted nucleic acid-binding protein
MVMIKKLRLYLETTVFNYYFDEARDGHEDTVRLFEAIGNGGYEAYTSEYVTLELKKTIQERKRNNMLDLIENYNINTLNPDNEVVRLGNLYIINNIIPKRYFLDSLHIAIATVNELDCVLSYNFGHINRLKTKVLTGQLNRKEGYNSIVICTPREVPEDEL